MVWRMPENWHDEYDGDKYALENTKIYLQMYAATNWKVTNSPNQPSHHRYKKSSEITHEYTAVL